MKNYLINKVHYEMTECYPDGSTNHNSTRDWTMNTTCTASSIPDLFSKLAHIFKLPPLADISNWDFSIMTDTLIISRNILCDGYCHVPSQTDIGLWEAGKLNLYNIRLCLSIYTSISPLEVRKLWKQKDAEKQ